MGMNYSIGSGWTTVIVNITEEEMQTLNSINSGAGLEILAAAGVGTFILIQDPIIKFNGESNNFEQATFTIYPENSGNYFTTIEMFADNINNRVYSFFKDAVSTTYQVLNNKIFLFSSADIPTFSGTATLVFEYKVITFS
jgi:hypothetical protein